MVCMTLYFLYGEEPTFVYSDMYFFIFFDDVVRHGLSMADGFGYESFQEGAIDFFSRHCLYQG